jgi:hypothetical protein
MARSLSMDEALAKARSYCARQERAQQEVRDKLYSWEVRGKEVEGIISQLIREGFLNEARFAEHFAVSKFRQKGWGRRKIECWRNGGNGRRNRIPTGNDRRSTTISWAAAFLQRPLKGPFARSNRKVRIVRPGTHPTTRSPRTFAAPLLTPQSIWSPSIRSPSSPNAWRP